MDIYNLLYFVLIFEFTPIYLLYVISALKVEGNFRTRKNSPRDIKEAIFIIYSIYTNNFNQNQINFNQNFGKINVVKGIHGFGLIFSLPIIFLIFFYYKNTISLVSFKKIRIYIIFCYNIFIFFNNTNNITYIISFRKTYQI